MKRFIEEHDGHTYDIIVIGGGITGAAVAYEAAARGFTVALVEKGDFGAATSAATSKLIHGGLRYLANFELKLVRESLAERKTLENIAPNLVYPLPFLVPLHNTRARSKWVIEPGMILYDLLSYDKGFTWDRSKRLPLHRYLSAAKVRELEPVVKPEGLTGAVLYYDCANPSPERLTLAFIKSAVKHGAAAANYAKVEDFIRAGQRITGVVVRDLLTGTTHALNGRVTINCGGPWADLLLDVARGKPGPQHVRRSEGIHIITRSLSHGHAIGGLTPDGRPCNIIPWRGHSLIGTTDRAYAGDPDAWAVTREKIKAYIAEVNAAFGDPNLVCYSDVLYAYGGLRPLVEDETKDVYRTSRRYEIYDNEADGLPGLITVEGGKYTTSRRLAENVLNTVARKQGGRPRNGLTARVHLAGCEIRALDAFLAEAQAAYPDFPPATVDSAARNYGTAYRTVLDLARGDKRYAEPLTADGELAAQVVVAVRDEMARTLADILLRRTGIGTLGHPGAQALETVAAIAAEELGWSSARTEAELAAAERALAVPR